MNLALCSAFQVVVKKIHMGEVVFSDDVHTVLTVNMDVKYFIS